MPPQKASAFDVEGARKAGYSDDEILAHLTQSRKFDVQGAIKSGYSKSDLISYLSSTPSKALSLPGGQPGDPDYATNQAQDVIKKQAGQMRGTRDGINVGASGDVAGAMGAGKVAVDYADRAEAGDKANLQHAKRGEPLQPVGMGPRMATSVGRGLASVGNSLAEHPVLTTGLALANTNPITGVPVDAALMGMAGVDTLSDIGDIAKQGFTADNVENLGVHGANAALAGAGAGGQLRALRDVPIDVQNEYAQRGLKPVGKGQEQFQDDIAGARPYLGGQGIDSQAALQKQIPGAQNEIWQPYNDAMQRIGGQNVQGPNGPTTYGELEARRTELSAQLNAVRSKDPAALQTIMQQGKTPADLEAEDAAIKGVLDPALQAQGINPLAIRNTFGNVKGVERLVSGRNTLGENSQPYGLGRTWANVNLLRPGTWIDAVRGGMEDVGLHRPLLSGKPTDVDIKTGLLSGADKPDFTNITSPQPLGPQPAPPMTGPGAPPPAVPPQYRLQGTGRPQAPNTPIAGRNVTGQQINTLPTQHPGEGDYAGLLPGPPAPFVPPAPGPDIPQVGGLPNLGHPIRIDDPMWTGEARPGIVPTRGPAAGNESGSMTTPGGAKPQAALTPSTPGTADPGPNSFRAGIGPDSFALPGGNPPNHWDTPAAPINPQEVIDLQEAIRNSRDFPTTTPSGQPLMAGESVPMVGNVTPDTAPEAMRTANAARNVTEGLKGNRRDIDGEIREAHRAKLEKKGQR